MEKSGRSGRRTGRLGAPAFFGEPERPHASGWPGRVVMAGLAVLLALALAAGTLPASQAAGQAAAPDGAAPAGARDLAAPEGGPDAAAPAGAADAAAIAGGGRLALLIIDVDSYLVQKAMAALDLPEGFEARAFTLKDLETDPAKVAWLDGSTVLVVDVMDSRLSKYVGDRGLLAGRSVYALRESNDDQGLVLQGFIFDDGLAGYYRHLGVDNVKNLALRALGLPHDPVAEAPAEGLWHPEAPAPFGGYDAFMEWYSARPGYDPGKTRLGMMFFSTSLIDGQREAYRDLILLMERSGFNVVPAFGTDLLVIENAFLDPDRARRVDLVLAFSLKFYSSLNDNLAKAVADLGVPVFNAVNLYAQTIDEWRESPVGLPATDVIWNLAIPEISGVIEPTPVIGKIEEIDPAGGGLVYRYELMPEPAARLARRLHRWAALAGKPNSGKRLAVLYYNHSQGKQNIGASYLNVFRSLEEILEGLNEAGYSLGSDLPFDEQGLSDQIMRSGRNIGAWAPGELEAMLESDRALRLPLAEYEAWFAELPAEFREKVLEQWGPPGQSDIMVHGGDIIIPMVRSGNLVLLPEPARGMVDDPSKLYHDPHIMPHHQYIAAYLWLEKSFGADAMIHLGTHATYEWLPGKQAGLSLQCPPEVMITDVPNVYPYIVDDVGEGLQAKRRGRGVVVDHLTPALVVAEGYEEYASLSEAIDLWEAAQSVGSPTAPPLLADVWARVRELGLDKDLGLDGPGLGGPSLGGPGRESPGQGGPDRDGRDRDESARAGAGGGDPGGDPDSAHGQVRLIATYLERLATGYIPHGLHTFGRSPEGEAASSSVQAVTDQHPELSAADLAADFAASGPAEMAGLLRALEGGFTPPKSGNDPVRNPDAVPTGGNFYGLAPDRLPTRAAWALGQEAARGIIEERRRQSGKYPEKVAVVLWAVESLRNEGLNEATIMALIGVEPVWHASGRVLGTRPIPAIRLGRPRIDVAIDMSGLYRDLFPEKALMLDAAIRQAALQDDADNLIRRNDARIRQALLAAGYSEAEADRLSRARIFSEAPGAYGNRVEELASASGLWEDDSALSEVFRTHTSFAYGSGSWGEPAPEALDANLEDAEVAWHSVSSTLYGVMDNDDMYMYLGGLSLAIRSLSGRAPTALIADQRQAGEVRMESLQGFIGREMRSRYLNPKWIEGMKAENYAGAREMSNYVEYLWGWQATTPESVDRSVWDQTYEVYVEDKYDLGIKRFLGEHNPWAFQSITARLLESARKGYWEADQAVLENLAREYVLSVLEKGLACCDHTCNNPMFHQMVMNLISIPGVMPMELAADFKLAVEKAAQKSLEDQVSERERLLEDLGRRPPRPDSEAGAAEAESRETVRGLKMEPIEAPDERAELSSSGVQWLATVAVLAIVALFLLGLRSRRGRD